MVLAFIGVELHGHPGRSTLGWIPVLCFEISKRPWFESDLVASTIEILSLIHC